MAEDGEAKVVRGASLLILLQFVSRAITFIANQVLLRFLTAELLGISTQLEVYYLSILFFARESLRVAVQRQGNITSVDKKQDQGQDQTKTDKADDGDKQGAADSTQAVVNLGYIAIPLGLLTAAVLGRLYLSSVPEATLRGTPYLARSVRLVALASVLELLAEPAFVVLSSRLRFGARAAAESAGTVAKCAVTLASAVWAARAGAALGVLPFALGQAAYGVGLLGVYAWCGGALARDEGFSLLPRRLGGGGGGGDYLLGYFYRPTLRLGASMMAQSFVKHVLTQGDTLLVSALSTTTAQGVYALANNYGGLAARLLFQPVEESSRSYFSRLLADAPAQDDGEGKKEKRQGESDVASPPQQTLPTTQGGPSKTALHQASANLTAILQTYTLVSLPLLALGPVAAPLLLSLVAGRQWAASGAGAALAAYVYYIPLLAVNGLAEAFVASVATEAQVHAQSGWMAAFSIAFAAAGYVLLRPPLDLGAVGLVAANAVNMTCRIAWALAFIRAYFRDHGVPWAIADILPHAGSVAAAAVAARWVRSVVVVGGGGDGGKEAAEMDVRAVLGELVKIAGVAVPFLAVLYVSSFTTTARFSLRPLSKFLCLFAVFDVSSAFMDFSLTSPRFSTFRTAPLPSENSSSGPTRPSAAAERRPHLRQRHELELPLPEKSCSCPNEQAAMPKLLRACHLAGLTKSGRQVTQN